MSNKSNSTYKFKPFDFTVLKENLDPQQRPLERIIGHHVVCNNAFLFSYGRLKPQTNDVLGQRVSSATRQFWKYGFDSGEWKVIKCQNVPQNLTFSSITLSGNIIIIYGDTGNPSMEYYGNRIYLGNLANEYKKKGMNFVELEQYGDVPSPSYGSGVVMDGKYIYSIGGISFYEFEMSVHRFDLSTRKWELLHKRVPESQDPEPRYRHEVVFYKGRIYIFGGKRAGERDTYFSFSKIHMFDVATKQWQLLPTKHDHRVPEAGYPINRHENSCVQCPKKSNLVYICAGYDSIQSFKDIWRLDFDTLQWEKFTKCTMPRSVNFQSIAVTPSGRMCCYGGIASDHITNAWIMIPKLKVICWEAMVYYFKEQMFESSDENLKKIGLPPEYYKRIIEARRIS